MKRPSKKTKVLCSACGDEILYEDAGLHIIDLADHGKEYIICHKCSCDIGCIIQYYDPTGTEA